MKLDANSQQTMMSKKFFSMLMGGTLTMLVASFLLMSDQIIAGAVIGPDAVAGVTLVTPLYSLAVFFGSLFSLGVPLIYAKEMGKFNKQGADNVFGFGLLMSVIVGIALFIMANVFGDYYLRSCNPSPEILAQARDYMFWMRFTILTLPLQTLINDSVYGDGDEKISSIANIVQGVGNIALSIILCNFMGIQGIGLASFLFNVISILILLTHFRKEVNSLHLNLYFSFDLLKETIRYSIIDSSSYLFLSIFTAALNAFVSNQFGSGYLIVVSGITLSRELQLLFDGIGEAVGPILSVYVGENSHKGLRYIYRLASKTAIVEGIAVTLVLVLAAPLLPMVMKVSQPEYIHWIVIGVRVAALGSIFTSLLYLMTSYYLVIEKIEIGIVICALRDVVFSAGLAVILGKAFGLYGMFAGLAVAPAFAYFALVIYITVRYGKEDFPMLLSQMPEDDPSYLFYLRVEPEQIIGLQKDAELLMMENEVDRRTIGRVKLLIEEIYMLIWEKNEGKTILGECTIIIKPEGIRIITKDDGVLFDISQEDVNVTSIASFAVSAYMEKLGEDRHHLTTMSYNRSAFLIKTDKE